MLLLKVGVVARVLRSLAAFICSGLYRLIAATYQLFMTISKLNVLSSDEIAPIYQRITMILTIVMTFYITFEFVKYSIQPETMTDKDKGVGNILQRIVLVVMMIAFVPTIFRLALGLQNRIIEDQIITKVLLGRSTQNYESYGNQFSAILLSQFYEVDEDNCRNSQGECSEARTKVDNDLKELSRNGKIDLASDINLYATEDPGLIAILRDFDPAIRFDGLFALGVGIFVAYILVLYSIDLGARYVQLIFLQMIAPIAIMGYLLPKKDGIFQKWVKQCTTTYLDLFLRVAIIDFIILIVTVLGEAFANPSTKLGIAGLSGSMKTFTYIALVMGLLMFAQRAPKLLGELFPSSGAAGIGFGFGAKNRIEPTTKTAKAAKKLYKDGQNTIDTGKRVTAGTGAYLAGLAKGRNIRERLRLAREGAKTGFSKDNKGSLRQRFERATAAIESRQQKEDELGRNMPNGVSQEQAVREAELRKEHWANIAAEQDRKAKLFETPSSGMDAINKSIDEFKQIKALKQELESAKARGASAAEVKTLDAKYKTAVQAVRKAIADVTDANGNVDINKFNELVRNGIKFKYSELDANGFARYEYEPEYEVEYELERDTSGAVVFDPATGKAKYKLGADGQPVPRIGLDGQPVYKKDSAGNFIPKTDGRGNIVYKLDSNGQPVVKIGADGKPVEKAKIEADFRFDSGDVNFAGSVARAENNEYLKMQAAAKDLLDDPETAKLYKDVKVKINDVEKTIGEWLADPNGRVIYAENINKFKDALVDPKNAYENSAEYVKAHGLKEGVGSGGGKK